MAETEKRVGRKPGESALALSPRKQRRDSRWVGIAAGMPKRTSVGRSTPTGYGPSAIGASLSQSAADGPINLAQLGPSRPIDEAVSASERYSPTAVPSSNGCAAATCGWIHSTPNCSSGKLLRNGEPATRGWTAAQTSCRKPGSVSSAVRFPPPIVSLPSITRTECPARAKVIAAASPFGPAPTTTASYLGIDHSERQRSEGSLENSNTLSGEVHVFGRRAGILSVRLGRMPPCQNPVPSGGTNIFVVHMKSLYRYISNGADSHNMQSGLSPRKVAAPFIPAGMKETNFLLSIRISGVGQCAFEAVVPGTGVAKIVESESAAFAARPDVFDMHLCAADLLRCPAVFTAELSTPRNLISQRSRDRRHLFWLFSLFQSCQ